MAQIEFRSRTYEGSPALAVYVQDEYFGLIECEPDNDGRYFAYRACERRSKARSFATYDDAASHVTDYAERETGNWQTTITVPADAYLSVGVHAPDSGQQCVMELASRLSGESWSDEPACVAPTLRTLAIGLNDRMPDDVRQGLLAYVPRLIGTAPESAAVAQRRAYICADYAVRVFAPLALDVVGIPDHAAVLRALPPITDRQSAIHAADAADAAAYAADADAYAAYAAAAAGAAARATGAADAADAAAAAAADAAARADAADAAAAGAAHVAGAAGAAHAAAEVAAAAIWDHAYDLLDAMLAVTEG